MSTEVLCRHFSRIGARAKIHFDARLGGGVRIAIAQDRLGEFFDVACATGTVPEILQVQPKLRHLVLMVREQRAKSKFLIGEDDGHWFVAAVPGFSVRDVRSAIDSLRPEEIAPGSNFVRQGEWFFAPAPEVKCSDGVIHYNEPISRGWGKFHWCEELARIGGIEVLVGPGYPMGISPKAHEALIARNPAAKSWSWRRMVRDAEVVVRGRIRHPDHKTVRLNYWHRVYLNRERFAPHARQSAFLD